MNKKRIIFFTPTFNRTGSELALFNLVINAVDDYEMIVVSNGIGELSSKLPREIKYISSELDFLNKMKLNPSVRKALKKGVSVIKGKDSFLAKIHKVYPSDLWYVNTITQTEVLSFARRNKIPLILHVHELEQMYNCISGEQLNNMISYPNLIIACSEACADIIKFCGRKDKIEVCYPAVSFKNINTSDVRSKEIRKKYGIADNAFLWLMSGTMDTNKNPSLFVDIANILLGLNSNVVFMWLNARNDDNGYIEFCKKKAETLGIADKIIWVSKLNDEYYDYFNACDGFVLTSTRESFSMVAAEAIYLGKPVVSFDCGGIKEIINGQTGIIINDFNVNSLVNAMISVMDKKFIFDPLIAKEIAMNFDEKVQRQKWVKIINAVFSKISIEKNTN